MDLQYNVQETGANIFSAGSFLSKRAKVHVKHTEALPK